MDNDKPKFNLEFSRDPFSVPENYFEKFSERMDVAIMNEIKENKKIKHIGMHNWVVTAISSAAVFAGLIIGGYALLNMQDDVDKKAEQIMAREIYIDEMMDMVDDGYIEDILAEAQFDY